MSIEKVQATGNGAIALDASELVNGQRRVLAVSLHLSAAPTTSENFTVTYNAGAGAAYDTLLFTHDLAASAVTDLVWHPEGEFWLAVGDSLDIAYPNTDAAIYGLEIALELP